MSTTPIALHLRPSATGINVRSGALRGFLVAMMAVFGLGASAQLPSFTVSTNGPITIPTGEYASVTATVTPVGGFTGAVVLSCQDLPAYATCKFPDLNSTVTLSSGAVTETFLLNTSAVDQYEAKNVEHGQGMQGVALGMLAPAACMLLFRRRIVGGAGKIGGVLAGVLVFGAMAALSGCASVKPASTPPGTYNVLVTGTYAGTTSYSGTLQLKVTS